MSAALLDVEQLAVSFVGRAGARTVVADVSFQLEPGEAVGVVGESGSGKSQTAFAVLGLLPDEAEVTADQMAFAGKELLGVSPAALNALAEWAGDGEQAMLAWIIADAKTRGMDPELPDRYRQRPLERLLRLIRG